MKIRISLTEEGEWSDCWLQTQYMGKSGKEVYRIFIYPTSWSEEYRIDGIVQYVYVTWYSTNLHKLVIECKELLKTIKYDRHLTKVQKACNFFKRLFAW